MFHTPPSCSENVPVEHTSQNGLIEGANPTRNINGEARVLRSTGLLRHYGGAELDLARRLGYTADFYWSRSMRDSHTPDYYVLLELSQTATEVEIKKAWHEQLQVWHPDRFTHAPALYQKAEARTKLINQAYETLSDAAARTRYDSIVRPASPSSAQRTQPASPSSYAAPPPRQAAPQSRECRGPQSPIILTKHGRGTVMVPAIHLYIDPREPHPYDFHGFTRIAGSMRESLAVGKYW
jgi:hypothetical protein